MRKLGADAYALNPVGTGPFKFVEWEVDDFMILEANPDYWGGAPKIKQVTFRWVAEAATKVAMLYAGEADIIDLVPPHLVEQIDSQPNFDSRTVGSMRAVFVTVNTFQEPFDDLRIRQAMAHAINWEAIIDQLYAGEAYKIAAVHPKDVEYFCEDIEPYSYDPDRAKELMTEAGHPDGFDLTFDTPAGWFYLDKETSQIITNNLQEVGINAEFWSAERGTFWDKWVNRGSELSYMACGNVQGGADFCYRLHFHSARRGIYFNSPEIENLLDTFAQTTDPETQADLACQFQGICP